MSDAPERVWVLVDEDQDGQFLELIGAEGGDADDTEYVRADLHAAAVARAEAAEAERDRLRTALADLEKAATEVARYGAQTGPQWSRLTIASLTARADLRRSFPARRRNRAPARPGAADLTGPGRSPRWWLLPLVLIGAAGWVCVIWAAVAAIGG